MTYLLLGQALVTFRLEFFYLQYLLPLLGSVLIYLGGRSLRGENKYFRLCWILGGARLVWNALYLVLCATPAVQPLTESWLRWPVSILMGGVTLLQLLALYGGTRLALASAGVTQSKDWLARGLAAYLLSMAIAIWADLVPLTQQSVFGQSVVHEWSWLYCGRDIAAVVLQIYFLACLACQSEALTGQGFDVTPAPARLSDRAVALAVFAAVALAIPVALFFSARASVEPAETLTAPLAGARTGVRDSLVDMGLPREIADMLDEAELARCADAVTVRAMASGGQTAEQDRPRDGRLTESLSGAESAMTAWAVLLPENQMRYYFLFRYPETPGGHFQEQFSLDPIGNYPTRDYTARLVWEQNGAAWTVCPQIRLAGGETEEEINWDAVWFPEATRTELKRLGGRLHESPWFNFSVPKGAEELRGYLAYTVDSASFYAGNAYMEPDTFYDSVYVFLRRRSSFLHYPFSSISELGGTDTSANHAGVESAWQLFMLYGGLLAE